MTLCCALAVDLKFLANLWNPTWDSSSFMAGNAGFGGLEVPFRVQTNIFGRFNDPYLISNNMTNPYEMRLTNVTVEAADGVSYGWCISKFWYEST